MVRIERNKHPSGRLGNITFGLAAILDGLVRAGSLGFFHTNLTLLVSRIQTRRMLDRLIKGK